LHNAGKDGTRKPQPEPAEPVEENIKLVLRVWELFRELIKLVSRVLTFFREFVGLRSHEKWVLWVRIQLNAVLGGKRNH